MAPVVAVAQNAAPAGYAPASQPAMMGLQAKPMPAQVVAAPAPHKHKFRTMCASCMKKQQPMPVERIVACAHSKNGVCPTCQTLLAMPGTVTMGAPAPAPGVEAPGRAMVSNSDAPVANQLAAQSAPVSAVYDPSQMPAPSPIGVMQANYAQPGAMPGAMPAAPSSIPTAASVQPGHAVAASGATPAPFQHKPTSSKNPHIISHLLGIRNVGADWREMKSDRKNQAHASIPYNNEGTTINELPASVVYGSPH